MAKQKTIEILQTDLLEHPAVKAWAELRPERVEPEQIGVLKREKKSFVYRLDGVGRGDSAVIAKRCWQANAVVERTIYERILPHLPVTTLHYYGCVEEEDGQYCWLFLEDASGENFSPHIEQHRVLAAEWLGTMHTSASDVAAATQLPDRGPHHYLDHLQLARDNILQNFANPVLEAEDRQLLNEILSLFDLTESNWSQVEMFCEGMPRTLVHGDFAGRNVRVRPSPGGMALMAYDWETAGWGVPAADLLHTDITVYWSVVRDYWPGMDLQTLQHWVNVGSLLRGSIAPISWQSYFLAYEWAHEEMRAMRIYQTKLCDAIRATGFTL